jgi:hypothetical protein
MATVACGEGQRGTVEHAATEPDVWTPVPRSMEIATACKEGSILLIKYCVCRCAFWVKVIHLPSTGGRTQSPCSLGNNLVSTPPRYEDDSDCAIDMATGGR